MHNSSNSVLEKQSFSEKTIINRSKKREIVLNTENLNLHYLKSRRTKARIVRFEAQLDRDGREDDETSKKLAKVIQSSNRIQNLEINCSKCAEVITDTGIKYLCRSIQKLNRLKSLSLDFTGCFRVTNAGFNCLSQILKALVSLKKLNLSFSRWKLNNEGLKNFCKSLRKLTHLEDMSLNFKGCDGIDDKSLEMLSLILKTLSDLRSINLNFSKCNKITKMGMQSLSQALKKCRNSLRDLNLKFKKCEKCEIENQSFYQDLEALTFLQSLDLTLHSRSERIIDATVQPLCQTLNKLVSLRKISLNFASCFDMDNRGLSALSQALKTRTNLQDLGFHLYTYEGVTDKGMHDFSQALKTLESLESLRLSFLGIEMVCWRGINDLNQALMNLKNLRKIHLKFSRCDGIYDKGLGQALGALTNLRSIHLNFNMCNEISESSFCKELECLGSLKSFGIIFNECKGITEEGLDEICGFLEKQEDLRDITIEFIECDGNFGNNEMKKLIEALKKFVFLQKLCLRFVYWSIGDEGIEGLVPLLATMTLLTSLTLRFEWENKISKEMDGRICQILKTLPYLKEKRLSLWCDEDE